MCGKYLLLGCFLVPVALSAQITGHVFRDVNGNGRSDKTLPVEKGAEGILVRAYVFNATLGQDQLLTQSRTDAAGRYELSIPAGQAVRVVFGSEGQASSGATPSVRFVRSPANRLDWGFLSGSRRVSDRPVVAAPVYVAGAGNDSLPALVAFSVEDGRTEKLATAAQTGALWGVAYDPDRQTLFSAALAKRHMGYGPLGTGGIYRTDWKTKQTSPWISLAALGIPTGKDHHGGLNTNPATASRDSLLMADVGTLSLGGIDVLGDRLFVMNLTDKTLYGIRIPADTAQRPQAKDLAIFRLPEPGCKGGVSRPFAVKVHEGKLYVGVVCDASASQLTSDLTASVYVLDTASRAFTEVVSLPLNYSRGRVVDDLKVSGWNPWTDDFARALHATAPSTAARPQPVLSSISFDADGAMLLGLMDRFGHQSGQGQPDPAGRASYNGVAAGDLLRVYPKTPNRLNGHYRLEANARTGSRQSAGAGNGQGPDGGEFFFTDHFVGRDLTPRVIHEETGAGGVAYLPGTDEVMMSAHEPANEYNTAGLKAFRSEDGSTSRGWSVYEEFRPGNFGKANGIGGIALVTEPGSIAAGDRIWLDANEDGIQDPEEEPLADQAVELWKDGVKLAQTQTDAEGRYLFSQENIRGGLQPLTGYEIRTSLNGLPLAVSKTTAGPDKEIDNDAVERDGSAVVAFRTKGSGENLHGLDIGLVVSGKPVASAEAAEQGNLLVYPNPASRWVKVEWKGKGETATLIVTNGSGKTVEIREIFSRDGWYRTVVNLTGQPAGIYMLRAGSRFFKVVKN